MAKGSNAQQGEDERRAQGEALSMIDIHHSPAMSVVVITPDCYETIRRTIEHLEAQTVRDRLELLIVAPVASTLRHEIPHLTGFAAVRVIEVGEIKTTAQANAAGVIAATAPVVAFIEDHAFPNPDWARALIAAHKQGWAAVGPVVGNANPGSLLSWADLIVGYTPWLEFAPPGVVEHLPAHNCSYKRDILLEYKQELDTALAVESVLHWDLTHDGHQLYLEPAAKIRHLNTSRPAPLMRQLFLWGRSFAAARSRSWSPVRRLLYACGAPLVPAVRAQRIMLQLLRAKRAYPVPAGAAPLVLLALIVSASGEMAGYAFGEGRAQEKMRDLELHRERYVRPEDVGDLDSTTPAHVRANSLRMAPDTDRRRPKPKETSSREVA